MKCILLQSFHFNYVTAKAPSEGIKVNFHSTIWYNLVQLNCILVIVFWLPGQYLAW